MYQSERIRLVMVKEPGPAYQFEKISSSRELATIAREAIGDSDREIMIAYMLDSKNKIVGEHIVSIGSLNAAIVHPRETFKAAILCNAAALVVVHNHPSGNVDPSREDLELTSRLMDCAQLLGIRLLDSIIVTDNESYCSFADKGLLTH